MFIEAVHAAEEVAHTTDPGLLGTFGINGKLFLAQLINFGILLFVMNRWVYKPLLKVMDDRKKKIEDGLKFAKDAEVKLAEARIHEDDILAKANNEAKSIVTHSKKLGDEERNAILAKTKEQVAREHEEATNRLAHEVEGVRGVIKSDVADLVTKATERVLGKGLDEKAHRDLIALALKDLEDARI